VGYVLRRLVLYAFAAWASLTLNFIVPRLAPGDPAQAMMARFQGQLQPEAMVALRESLGGGDGPILGQYGRYLVRTLTGDLGTSSTHFPAPVSEVIATGLVWTVVLAGTAMIISVLAGSLLGLVAAWRRGG
jgi:peptide/nickel transport system permease protein